MSRDPFDQLFKALDRTRHLSDTQVDEMFSVEPLYRLARVENRELSVGRLRRRWWRRGSVIASVAFFVVGSAATAITLSRGPVQTVADMTCYQGDSLRTTPYVVSYAANPLAFCSQLLHWSTSAKKTHEKGSLCLLSDGSLAAFPPTRSSELCKSLGLTRFNGHLANPDLAKFQIAAENYFTIHQCESLDSARQAMLRLLGTNGVVGWKVRLTGLTSPRACATLAFLLNSSEVDIVGIHR
jgi:hypothetical protein